MPLLARRDSPEIILPEGTASGVKTIGNTDTLTGTWSEICSAAEFGAADLTLAGVFLAYRVGATTAVSGALVNAPRQGRILLAAGAAGSEQRIATVAFAGQAVVQMILVSGSGSAFGLATPVVYLPIGPVRVAASTRLSYDGAVRDANGHYNTQLYAVAYDTDTWTLHEFAETYRDWFEGRVAADTLITDYTTFSSGGAPYTNGAYVTANDAGNATAQADYLITAMYVQDEQWNATMRVVDLAIGTAGNEVVQARAAYGSAIAWYGPYAHQFTVPVLWQQGETLRVRMREGTSNVNNAVFFAQLVKLP